MNELSDQEIRAKWKEICTADRKKNCIIDSGAFAIELIRWRECYISTEMSSLAKERNIVVIEMLGETILQPELDALAETWVHIGMPRGKYTLHSKEIEQLTNDIRKVVSRYNKPFSQPPKPEVER